MKRIALFGCLIACMLPRSAAGATVTNITKKPMLQDVRTDAMALLWETDRPTKSNQVEWGTDRVTENSTDKVTTIKVDDTHFVHKAIMTGLKAQSSYVYRVRSGQAVSAIYRFRTAPQRETPFRVAWIGDNQHAHERFRQHIPHIAARKPDLICSVGDIVSQGKEISAWGLQWFGPLEIANLAQTTPVVFARGNHDGEHVNSYAYSNLPGNQSFYAYTYGNTRFIVLNSNVNPALATLQVQWLQKELASPQSRLAAFRVVSVHKPPFTDLWDSVDYNGEAFIRTVGVPLFEKYQVDLVLSGHAHAYERGTQNGVTYMIVGGAGGSLDTFTPTKTWGFFDVLKPVHHYMIMDVEAKLMTLRAYNLNDELFDTYTIRQKQLKDP